VRAVHEVDSKTTTAHAWTGMVRFLHESCRPAHTLVGQRRRRPPVRWRAAHLRWQLERFVSSRFHWHQRFRRCRHSGLLAEPLAVGPPVQELAVASVSCQHEQMSHLRSLPFAECMCAQKRRLTLRSSGPSPAWHLAREPMQSIVPSRGPSTMPVASAQLKR
jgi:hypothetical protein